jgi:hypothetical protein
MCCNGAGRQELLVAADMWQPDDGGCASKCRSGCWTAPAGACCLGLFTTSWQAWFA